MAVEQSNAGIVAGVGFRSTTSQSDVVAVVRAAEAKAARRVTALAAPAFKADHCALHAAAVALGVPVILVADEDLRAAQPRCVTRSAAAERATGFAAVAEGCALAAAGPAARLLLPRIATAQATCALAESAA